MMAAIVGDIPGSGGNEVFASGFPCHVPLPQSRQLSPRCGDKLLAILLYRIYDHARQIGGWAFRISTLSTAGRSWLAEKSELNTIPKYVRAGFFSVTSTTPPCSLMHQPCSIGIG